ncbi:MAG TPA: hypothetical protein VFZ09_03040 [Archangium sp.]|uniref:hypothetical protein n=1 Tax=Archangium sp. TaxID=1872627 RepID=UPI002E340DB8|nr:hypothetical protein [Archangium sp.]HEX5745190.1 hypothetical protein [Archangium sp.]
MSTTHPWISSAQEELLELELRHAARGLEPRAAYRVLVLEARLAQARAAGWEAGLRRGQEELARLAASAAALPDPRLLLERLEALLLGDEDPFGELMDALLDVDNAATVDDALGRTQAARELVLMADARVSLCPARVGALGELAEQRLETLSGQASVWSLWQTVAQAAVQAVAEVLPPVTPAPDSLSRSRLLARLRKARIVEDVSAAPLLAPLFAVAAAEGREPGVETFSQGAVDLYLEDGEVRVLVALPRGKKPVGDVALRVSMEERSITWSFRIWNWSKSAVIARLGKVEELRERLRREGFSAPLTRLQFMVSLALEDVRDDDT